MLQHIEQQEEEKLLEFHMHIYKNQILLGHCNSIRRQLRIDKLAKCWDTERSQVELKPAVRRVDGEEGLDDMICSLPGAHPISMGIGWKC
jgi:hypothetical protein